MLQATERAWRVFATGLCFTGFGCGGLALRLIAFPLLGLCVRRPQRRQRACRFVVQQTFRFFVGMMNRLGVLSYETHGTERLHQHGQLILANHPSLIDTVFLIALVPDATCIVKAALWNNPFTRGPVRAAGYIRNVAGPDLIELCIAALRAGDNLIVFPEGTRTPRSGLLPFQRGAANIAVRGDVPVTPVVIQCSPPTLLKGEPWYQVPPRRPHYRFRVLDPLHPNTDPMPRAAVGAVRAFTVMLENYFRREIGAI